MVVPCFSHSNQYLAQPQAPNHIICSLLQLCAFPILISSPINQWLPGIHSMDVLHLLNCVVFPLSSSPSLPLSPPVQIVCERVKRTEGPKGHAWGRAAPASFGNELATAPASACRSRCIIRTDSAGAGTQGSACVRPSLLSLTPASIPHTTKLDWIKEIRSHFQARLHLIGDCPSFFSLFPATRFNLNLKKKNNSEFPFLF